MTKRNEHEHVADNIAHAAAGHHGLNGWKLVIVAMGVGLLVVFAFFWNAHQRSVTDRRICVKVDRLEQGVERLLDSSTARPKPGDYGYAYWRAHPEERGARGRGVDQFVQILRKAACDPGRLPDVRLKP